MLSSAQKVNNFDFAAATPSISFAGRDVHRQVYEANRHRVYAVAFWMTDSELAAEELMIGTFQRAFREAAFPTAEDVDRALVAELREFVSIGSFVLHCAPVTTISSVRKNTLRVELERAVIQLPATEKLIFVMHDVDQYSHDRIARLLGITESDSKNGLHQARLRIRELLAN